MRKYALVNREIKIDISDGFDLKKVMIYETPDNDVFLFLYNTIKDTCGYADLWFETLEDAEDICRAEYGIRNEDWISINDPLPFCQHDFIAPVRVKGRENGQPEWGSLEILIDGMWRNYSSM